MIHDDGCGRSGHGRKASDGAAVCRDLRFAAGNVDECIQVKLLAVTIPPLRFAPVTRAEHHFGSVRKLEFDLDHRVLTACATTKPVTHVLPSMDKRVAQ